MKTKKNTNHQGPFYHENHARPVTRRELLAQGFLGMSATVLMPTLLSSLWSRAAFGAECATPTSSNSAIPFLVFDLAGGANLPGSNVIVGKAGGQKDYISSYVTLGLPDAMHPKNTGQINEELGIAFHADSAFLRGLVSVTRPETRANIDGAVFCSASNDDTANNPHNPAYWIMKAGASGELVSLVGTVGSASGGTAIAPAASVDPAARPVQIQRPQDVLGIVNPGKLAQLLSADDVKRILKATHFMSASQLAMFQAQDMPTQIKTLVECGYIQSSDIMTKYDATRLDPTRDEIVPTIFPQLANNAEQQKVASIAKLVIDGYAGAGTIQKGGYDYHNGSRATGEQKDFEAGVAVGQAIELAARKGKDLMVYVYTDGGVTSNGTLDNSAGGRGKGSWQGDSSDRSAAFTLVYKKDGKPEMRGGRRQIGSFKDTGAVDRAANKISDNVENLTKAIVANYLALSGKEGQLAKAVGDNPFGGELEQYLAFNKLR